MAAQRRKFQRPQAKLRYKKLFVIAAEGSKTEQSYFNIFTKYEPIVKVACLKNNNDSSPLQVLKKMKVYLRSEELRSTDEAWLVVDKDKWTDQQLTQLHQWAENEQNYGFALSNPKFEYWLLLHFEEGTSIGSSSDCTRRLKHYIPDYNKEFDAKKITDQQIKHAIQRAKKRDHPRCDDWPKNIGQTTVYRLIEKIFTECEE